MYPGAGLNKMAMLQLAVNNRVERNAFQFVNN